MQTLRLEKKPGNFGVPENQENLSISRREWSAVFNTVGRDKTWEVTIGSGNKAVLGDFDKCSLNRMMETEAQLEQFEEST